MVIGLNSDGSCAPVHRKWKPRLTSQPRAFQIPLGFRSGRTCVHCVSPDFHVAYSAADTRGTGIPCVAVAVTVVFSSPLRKSVVYFYILLVFSCQLGKVPVLSAKFCLFSCLTWQPYTVSLGLFCTETGYFYRVASQKLR